ncbi:hypothetical protein [Actinoplanes palleronii]|uniref:Uncharacterized protein n=1 Tax=Actinoplanes palleronii TaxID=113570 RepID=A0ABQ4B438_9ACTN|nr:hypothetical protein [Actinoplanes palleronii]GIE65422.1 hypothetical protein Apa02nite_015300 [Actinoplanes palleronii]
MTKAVIYLPAGEINATWLSSCLDHCQRRGYEASVIIGNETAVGELLLLGEVRIVIVARPEHFNPQWWPTIEVVGAETRRIAREVIDGVIAEEPVARPANDRPGRHRERRPRALR